MAEERQTNPFLKTSSKSVQSLLKESDPQKCFVKLHQLFQQYFQV